jgi:hypothetical protein
MEPRGAGLLNCPKCNEDVSEVTATACPACGEPINIMPLRTGCLMMFTLLAVIGGFLVAVYLMGPEVAQRLGWRRETGMTVTAIFLGLACGLPLKWLRNRARERRYQHWVESKRGRCPEAPPE